MTGNGKDVRIGFQIPQAGPNADAEFITEFVRLGKRSGVGSFWVGDHILTGGYEHRVQPGANFLEPIVSLSFMAGLDPDIELGTAVLVVPYRNALVLAKSLSSLAHLTRRRISVGVGTGWAEVEFDALGVPFKRRGKSTDEFCEVLNRLRTQPYEPWQVGPYSYRGGGFDPPMSPLVETWIGGESEYALRRAARWGSAWQPSVFGPGWWQERGPNPTEYKAATQKIREQCEANGRNADSVMSAVKLRLHNVTDEKERSQLPALFEAYHEAGVIDFECEVSTADRGYALAAIGCVMECFSVAGLR
jgi:alkanesulfonate monooxygenase SsuD/methylene tetrahydromethanopterin reductase-like flavin-dependent oxidoreductase (luciferase family)